MTDPLPQQSKEGDAESEEEEIKGTLQVSEAQHHLLPLTAFVGNTKLRVGVTCLQGKDMTPFSRACMSVSCGVVDADVLASVFTNIVSKAFLCVYVEKVRKRKKWQADASQRKSEFKNYVI